MDREYEIVGRGITPLLMHWDNIEWADQMGEWRLLPANKDKSKPGDDRTPAWTWIGAMYHDDEHVVIPQENVMRCLSDAGAKVMTGHKQETFKRIVPGGMIPLEAFVEFQGPKGQIIEVQPLFDDLMEEPQFSVHATRVQKHGFKLFVKRARIGATKHIRVRPRFDEWAFRARVLVTDEKITEAALSTIAEIAGSRLGIGDWRPSAPRSPGPFGRFEASVAELT
jgi:hypothetical protein